MIKNHGEKMNIYAYQRPVRKINDMPELQNKFIAIFDTRGNGYNKEKVL
jgi:hypothetical protein